MAAPDVVLVHGAWHSSACWAPLAPLLAGSGHRVHCPDLPGHGANRVDIRSLSLKTYTNWLADYVAALDVPVVLLGHSMSGMVIAQVAQALPERIHRLVFLSAYLPVNGQSLFDLIAANRGDGPPAPIEQAMYLSPDKRLCLIDDDCIAPLFYNRCPAPLATAIPATFPPQAALPLAGKVSLDAGGFGRVPKTYICCLDDRVIPIRHQRAMLKRQPCDEMLQLDTDHSPFLTSTETLAAILNAITLEH